MYLFELVFLYKTCDPDQPKFRRQNKRPVTYHYAPEFLPREGQKFQWFIYSATKFAAVEGKREIPFGSITTALTDMDRKTSIL